MPVMTAKEVIERFLKIDPNEVVLITWWEQSDTPDYDFDEGDYALDNLIAEVNDVMESSSEKENN